MANTTTPSLIDQLCQQMKNRLLDMDDEDRKRQDERRRIERAMNALAAERRRPGRPAKIKA